MTNDNESMLNEEMAPSMEYSPGQCHAFSDRRDIKGWKSNVLLDNERQAQQKRQNGDNGINT